MDGFQKGINIGGWLAQFDVNENKRFTYKERTDHFNNFISVKDIERIAQWGADHIRLPLNGDLILDENGEEYMEYIDRCIQWGKAYGVNIILDIHEIRGHEYGQMYNVIPLLKDRELQQRFIEVWKKIAGRYVNVEQPVLMFELLNEISDASQGYLWRRLYKEVVNEIRRIDNNHYILIGSNDQNSVFELNSLELLSDDKIIYGFHFYEPLIFTHQKAHFSEDMLKYNRKIHYPDTIHDFVEFLNDNPDYINKFKWIALEKNINKELLEKALTGARLFCQYSGKELYCGEFGVINNANLNDINSYSEDMVDLLKEYGIGYAYWNYKEMDFGIVDKDSKILNNDLVSILFK